MRWSVWAVWGGIALAVFDLIIIFFHGNKGAW